MCSKSGPSVVIQAADTTPGGLRMNQTARYKGQTQEVVVEVVESEAVSLKAFGRFTGFN